METGVADRWIYGLLSVDATLAGLVGTRIYRGMAPLGATMPCVVFLFMPGGTDVRGTGTYNVMVSGRWVIKAIDRDQATTTANSIADRIDTLLHGQSGAVSGGSVLGCVRDEPVSYIEQVDGAIYQHVGGIYQIWAQ